MAFPDHRGQALERDMEDVNNSIEKMKEEIRGLQLAKGELIDRVSKLEHQLKWIQDNHLTLEEWSDMDVYCAIQ